MQGHEAGCGCGQRIGRRIGRRGMLLGAAALLAGAGTAPARAAKGGYEAMILACIDPRIQEPTHAYAVKQGLVGRYSQFTIAGAAIGVVAPKFADWHKAFWDNLALTVELHKIKKIIALDHRDCGAARMAYGATSVTTGDKEIHTHSAALVEFRKAVGQRHPKLGVETGLMALDGSVLMFS